MVLIYILASLEKNELRNSNLFLNALILILIFTPLYYLHSSWYGSSVLKSLQVGGKLLCKCFEHLLQGALNNVI